MIVIHHSYFFVRIKFTHSRHLTISKTEEVLAPMELTLGEETEKMQMNSYKIQHQIVVRAKNTKGQGQKYQE